MKFEIGQPIVSSYKNSFVLEVEWMHGDADAFTTEEHRYFSMFRVDREELARHIEFLDTIAQMFKHGMGGCDTYLEEFGEDRTNYIERMCDTIPRNQFCCEGDANLQGYKLYFYDENAIKHHVKVIK